jgi:methionyl-tRNA formyltransferase
MKIIFMGTPDFAVPALKELIASPHEIVAVYTQAPKAANRGMKISKSKVHEVAEANNLKVFTPTTLKNAEEQNNFKSLNADIAVVAAYGMLLPKEILIGTKYGCINIHPSLLPRWRGAAPLQRTLIEGDKKSAVCIMRMDEGLDTGDIILQENFDIPASWNLENLHNYCAEVGAKLTIKAIAQIADGSAKYIKQSEDGVLYAKKIKKEDELINFNHSGEKIINQIRGLSPFPSAYFIFEGLRYKIFEAEFVSGLPRSQEVARNDAEKVFINDKFQFVCADGLICPKIIQKEGKTKIKIEDFLKGIKS